MDDFERREHEVEHRLKEKTYHLAEAFTSYVIDEAGATITVGAWDRDVIPRLVHTLEQNDYAPADDDGESLVTAFAAHEVYYHLRDAYDTDFRLFNSDAIGEMEVQRVTIMGDRSVPDETVLAVHHHAITPSHPGDIHRPWVVKDPKGVVVVRLGPREASDE